MTEEELKEWKIKKKAEAYDDYYEYNISFTMYQDLLKAIDMVSPN